MSDVLSLTQALIARDSVTPNDAGCLDMIAERLRPLDFHLEFISAGGVTNLWARRGQNCALGLLCRPHRCGADRPAGQVE